MSWLILHYHTGRRQWSHCSMPMIRLQEVELLVSESLRTAKSFNVVKWFSFIDCTISMPSVIEAFEVDAGIRELCPNLWTMWFKPTGKVSLIVLPHCSITEERGRVMVVLQPAGGGGLSACLRHESRRLAEAAKTIHQFQVSAYNPFICESFRHIPYVDTLHFLRGSQKCFAGVSHNRSLIKSMKITLLLPGMQFVEFSTSVDAFWAVVMFIRWSEHYSSRTNHGVHTFFNVLHIPLVLVGTGITYMFSSISPRVTQFFESLSVFSWKEGERRW